MSDYDRIGKGLVRAVIALVFIAALFAVIAVGAIIVLAAR